MTPPTRPDATRTPGLEEIQAAGTDGNAPILDSARILAGNTEVVIRHNGRHYRLRCTRLGKLILTA